LYQYFFRPAYHSEELLIDVFSGAESEIFTTDFLHAIEEIKPKMTDILDLWMNDEVIMTIDSEIGQFTLSKDIWGFGFITAENNQEALIRINSILEKSELFEKVEVDFENYK
jgi:cold shock CspA family protein